MEVAGAQNRPMRARRARRPAATPAPMPNIPTAPRPATSSQETKDPDLVSFIAVMVCVFILTFFITIKPGLAELRATTETSFETLNKIAQFINSSESRPPAVASFPVAGFPVAGFPIVIPPERMPAGLSANATAYCRADLTHCIFDNIDAERLPKRYTVTADKDTGLHRLDIAAYRNSWTGVDIFLFVMMPIAVVFYTICDGIRQCIQISIESTKLSDTALTKHKAELADSPPSEIPVAARPGELTRCFAAAVAGTYAFGDFGDFRLVCGPDGLWLMGKTWCCDYMRYMHFVKAERAELIPGARVVDGTMSDAFCGSADTIYKLTPELSITSFGGGDYRDRPDGMPRISLLGVVYDGVEIPPE